MPFTTLDRIDAAARWLVEQSPPPHPVVPALRERFKLTAAEAIAAIRQAELLRWPA